MKPELITHVQHARALAHTIRGRRPAMRPFARQNFPRAVEQFYVSQALDLMGNLRHRTLQVLQQHGPAWVAEYKRVHQRHDAPADQLDDDLALVKVDLLNGAFSTANLRQLAHRVAGRTEDAQRRELQRQLRVAVGIEVPVLDKDLGAQIDAFTSENVSRIRGLPDEALEQVKRTVLTGLVAGDRWEEIAGDVASRVDVSEARATLIARDQVGKFYSSLNRTRQQNLGLTAFYWRADNDERTCDVCGPLDGKRFTWSDLPDAGAPGDAHPNCRCTADPDVDALLDSL